MANRWIVDEARAAAQTPVDAVTDRAIAGPAGNIPIRLYIPEGDGPFPLLVFLHGGGFVVGSLDSYDVTCRTLCRGAGYSVISVDCHLAPEHKFPAVPDDCLTVTR